MRNFNLDDFQKWIEEQEETNPPKAEFSEGDFVKSSVSFKKLVAKISSDQEIHREVCKEFYMNGGTIVNIKEKSFIVEVASGKFSISKIYVEHD